MASIWDLSSEQRLGLLAGHAIDYGILMLDPRGIIVEWSQGAQHLLGWSAQEAVNRSGSLVFIPQDQQAGTLQTELETALREGCASDERWHLRKDGTHLYAGCVTRPIYGPAHELLGFGKIIRDLSRRKVTLDLAAQQARLLDQSHDTVLIWNFNTDKIIYWNKAAQERYGFSPDQAIGSRTHDLLATRFPESLEKIKETLLARTMWEGMLVHTAKSGRQIQVQCRMVLRDEFGDDPVVLETNRDITQEKQAEEAMRASEERFRTLVTATSQMVWTTNPEGYIKEDSPSWRAFTGQTAEEYMGMGWIEALHPEDRERAALAWSQCVANRCLYSTEYRLKRHDGAYRWTVARGVPIINPDGSIREWIGTNTDITQRKQAEIDRQRFVTLAKFSNELIGMADLDLKPFFINPAGAALVGLDSVEAALEKTVADFFYPEDQSFILHEFLPKAIRDGAGETEIRFRHFKTGKPIWVIYSVFILRDEQGKLIGHATISRDITERRHMEEALREAQTRLESTLEAAEVATWIWDIRKDRVIPDRNLAKMFAISEKDGAGAPLATYLAAVHQDDVEYIKSLIQHVVHTGEPFQPTFRVRNAAGQYHWVIGRGRVKYDDDGTPLTLSGVVLDITLQKQAEEALRISNERLNLAVEGAGEGVWEWDVQNDLIYFSDRFKEITGFTDNELSEDPADWLTRIHPDDLPRSSSAMLEHLQGHSSSYSCEYRVQCKSGEWKWVHSRGVLIERSPQGIPLRVVGIIGDISARKESEERIWHLANFDTLTALPNRRLFRERLGQEILSAQRQRDLVALMFVDLDRFKQVNDLLGHEAGDALLIQAARRIRECVREVDTVARLGGDEFTVILGNLHSMDHVEQIAQKVLDKLALPFSLGSEKVFLSGSIGIAIYPDDASSPEELIRKADQAMYAAKYAGKNQFSYFTREMDEKAHMRLRLLNELRDAIAADQITVHYQPVVELASNRVFKAEALVRWHHPVFGDVSPSEFIPLAEESGLINAIGDHVFREVAERLKYWQTEFGLAFQVGINKSPLQFATREDMKWIDHLQRLGLPPSSLVIEITEGILLDVSEQVSSKLLEYRDAGIQVAIDDFGTGYSSMSYLQKLDIDYLKIDQSFVRDMENNPGNRTIAESVIVMAHKLGLQVIAEGVETKEQADMLTSAGCDFGQGFFYSRPLPAGEFEHLLVSNAGMIIGRSLH